METTKEIEYLIVGAGPAGAALASFLGQNALKGLVISKANSTALTPRAHLTNPAALECMRDIGLEEDVTRLSRTISDFGSIRWARSVAGEEHGKVSWWNSTLLQGALSAASPCIHIDAPQSDLEPVLLKYASHHGFDIRFSTDLISISRLPDRRNLCRIHDMISDYRYTITAKYVFGADGGRSQVARDYGFLFDSKPAGQLAYNIFFKADLSHIINDERKAGLTWIANPEGKFLHGTSATVRLVRPWTQWVLTPISYSSTDHPFQGYDTSSPELVEAIREAVGDPELEVEILAVDTWSIRETVAKSYADAGGANAYILGDAAHRHSPGYGLGSNTCIQDAYNLAWKIAYVACGIAGPGLLKSYNAERQPVGTGVVNAANSQIRAFLDISTSLGMNAPTTEDGIAEAAKLSQNTDEGAKRRALLHEAFEAMGTAFSSLGVMMNHWYVSDAVYLGDEKGPRPPVDGDSMVKYQISTYPGSRLPHAWLEGPKRGRKRISTQDLAGKGAFALFTGVGGEAWITAAEKIGGETGIPIRAFGIGFGLQYHDVLRDWRSRRGVDEDGCVLVRPDRFVTWRAERVVGNCEEALRKVLDAVLARGEL
ncbi:FAD binding domain-containing protein [Xylariaceae sp. FL0255]|nr:FAD binding domain-containing protein [Xylariaceae sp. FL0255]